MDCEKFDNIVMDLLCGELEELPRAAALRHIQQCSRCRTQLAEWRATREVAQLPLVDPPEGLALRIINAEREVRRELPLGARISRALTIAAGYAMRPQLAMAALLVLMVGTGLLLLRPRPGAHSVVRVTEQGVPATDQELVVTLEKPVAEPVAPAAPTAPTAEPTHTPADKAASASSDVATQPASPRIAVAIAATEAKGLTHEEDAPEGEAVEPELALAEDQLYSAAMASFRAGDFTGALNQFDALAKGGGKNSAASEFYAALAIERAENCAAALPRFDAVSARNPSNDLGHQATWHSASCRVQLGQVRRATLDLGKLSRVPAYARQATQALAQLGQGAGPQQAAKAAAPRPASAKKTAGSAEPASGQDPVAP